MNQIPNIPARRAQSKELQEEMESCLRQCTAEGDLAWPRQLWQIFYQSLPESWQDELLPGILPEAPPGRPLHWWIYVPSPAAAHRFHFMSHEVLRRLQHHLRQQAQQWPQAQALLQRRIQLKALPRPDLWRRHRPIPSAQLDLILRPRRLSEEEAEAILNRHLSAAEDAFKASSTAQTG